MASFTTTDDALVLASVSSPAERGAAERLAATAAARASRIQGRRAASCPTDDPPPGVLARLVEELEADEDRTVVPVRVFWVPGGLPTRSKVVALDLRPRYLPAAGDPADAASSSGTRHARGWWPANPRRCPSCASSGATPPSAKTRATSRISSSAARAWPSNASSCGCSGPEYKSPQLMKPEMLASARFREGLEKIPGATLEKAGEMLDELATGWSRFSVDLIPSMGRAIFSRGFDPNIDYDRAEIESMRHALETHPAVLLFSHRSYLDGVIVPVAMQENRLPPVHTFAGINLSFGFMGPLMRRSGVIFIRRKLDDPLYKYVLRQFVGYIVEKRFNLSWSIEGTRSRTGKMLPPKLGLLSYVADAYLDGRSDDILLQPVSISFDQLHETAEYAAYARGGEKTPEGLSWLYNFIKAQGERNYGKIYVRFPEAVSMREYLGEPHGPMTTDEAAKRLAHAEDGVRGGLADPARHAGQRDGSGVGAAADHPRRRADAGPAAPHPAGLAGLSGAQADSDDQQRACGCARPTASAPRWTRCPTAIRSRASTAAREPVWRIAPEDEHEAAFYRNTIIDAFLETVDRRAGAGLCRARRRRSVGGVLDVRRCGCATC